ncbi:hypothetical protein DFH09DRAFT_1368108 [Mycena vulgaris]|nr:hypothetical protein DFH09DRAFT_1375268 [Mycena vulgaris]KAJ6542311.1 hypothetical protein DFH09DRAFT_1368108 [Mycena vulgaris]
MVNLVNITSLAGALTLVKIFDFQDHLINLAGGFTTPGTAILSFPEADASNENWFLNPIGSTTFTLQSQADSTVFVSYTGKAVGDTTFAGVVASGASQATVFRMEPVAIGGPAVNFIEATTNAAVTAWKNPDSPTYANPATPLTMEPLMNPKSFMQSFIVELVLG